VFRPLPSINKYYMARAGPMISPHRPINCSTKEMTNEDPQGNIA